MKVEQQIGMVVPVLNDAPALGRLLEWRADQCPGIPLWVADAGGHDGSAELAREAGASLLHTMPGRGVQMNRGAVAAIGAGCDVLWFVHADTIPPADGPAAIAGAIRTGAVGGAFRRRYDSPSAFLKATCRLADTRGRLTGWFLGDQAIFATARAFGQLGGFPEWSMFEDLEFARRLRSYGRTVLIRSVVVTSGRRFEALGPFRQTLRDLRLTWNYLGCADRPEAYAHGFAADRRGASK